MPRWRSRIEQVTAGLLDAVAGKERFDLIAALAYPLPVIIVAEMLGVRPRDMVRFEQWSHALALSVDPLLGRDQIQLIKSAAEQVYEYFESIIDERRRAPREDLVSGLLSAEEEGHRLTHEELLSVMLLILVAGNEPTQNVIGNGMLALLKHPDQLRRPRHDPTLLKAAVDELLRCGSPVQLTGRSVRKDVEIGGKLCSVIEVSSSNRPSGSISLLGLFTAASSVCFGAETRLSFRSRRPPMLLCSGRRLPAFWTLSWLSEVPGTCRQSGVRHSGDRCMDYAARRPSNHRSTSVRRQPTARDFAPPSLTGCGNSPSLTRP